MNNLLAQATTTFNLGNNLGAFDSAKDLKIENMVSGFIGLLLVVAGLAFFIILVVGGIKWILSGGDKGHTEAARNQITAALVGLVIVFSAWAIINLIYSFFGVNIMELTIPSATGNNP